MVLIDCSVGHGQDFNLYFEEPDAAEKEKAVWTDIDQSFSAPANPNDTTADYAPTQILSDLFRHNGFDGIAYKSRLGLEFNIALFDVDAADLINCFLYEVKSISYKFEETGEHYFVSKYYEK